MRRGRVLLGMLAAVGWLAATPLPPHAAETTAAAHQGIMTAEQILGQLKRTRSIAGTAKVDLPRVTFEFNSATLTPEAKAQLDELAKALVNPAFAGLPFTIAGHTDAMGAEDYNQRLSEERAQAVGSFLESQHGFDASRIKEVGYGKSQLMPDLPPDAAEQRRVEIKLEPAY